MYIYILLFIEIYFFHIKNLLFIYIFKNINYKYLLLEISSLSSYIYKWIIDIATLIFARLDEC